jgi:serine/threonine-protein kinase
MNSERWQQVQGLFLEALALDASRRSLFLHQACANDPELRDEVESLLAADAETHSLLSEPLVDLHAAPKGPPAGRRIGPFKVLAEIGHGGLGTVYRAARADDEFEQQVALKVIRRGMDTDEVVSRFRRERQILANLEHPHIAHLLDGGTTEDGRPYFVMELVKGEPLDGYCDSRRLSIAARLRLFLHVCSAVEFAHRNLVVHRDLKPGNILVTDDGPKLLDFGIAKLLTPEPGAQSSLTRLGSIPMTPEYASPEQARGEAVTTASDVYSLGVLLYQLVSGHLPCQLSDCDTLECIRRICEEEPRRPSTVGGLREEGSADQGPPLTPNAVSAVREGSLRRLRRRLAGDLDCIVLKALRKEPEHRYGSVDQLSQDLHRHLDGLPVLAREGVVLYRTRKFVCRHRWRLAAVLMIVVAVSFEVMTRIETAQQVAEAELAERLASERAEEANEQASIRSELLRHLFTASDVRSDESLTFRELLDRGQYRVRSNLDGEPLATQLEILGQLYGELALDGEAKRLLEDALELRRELYDGDHALLARAINNLALWHYRTGDFDIAGTLFQESLDMRRRLGQSGVDLVKAMSNLATIRMTRGDYPAAEELYRVVLEIRESAYGSDDPSVATSLRTLGTLFYLRGDLEHAEPLLRRALRIRRHSFGESDLRVASAESSLARVLHAQTKFAEAEGLFEMVLATRQELLGEDHPHVALTHSDLGALLLDLGETEAAEAQLAEALPVLRAWKGEGAWEVAEAESLWGVVLTKQGRFEEAEPFLLDGYWILRDERGAEAIYTRNAYRRLVELYNIWGRPTPGVLHIE